MKLKKRRKSGRQHGSQTHGRGAKERTRGSGNRGGKGMAGTGKRADHHKSYVLRYFGKDYWGKDKALRRGRSAPKLHAINLSNIEQHLSTFIKEGKAKESKGKYSIDLTGYKVLADGPFSLKAHITASAASQSAITKVKAAGGELKVKNKQKNEDIEEEGESSEDSTQ